MKEEIDSRLAVSRLAVMAFVRITCARAGSAAKDWCATGIRIRMFGPQRPAKKKKSRPPPGPARQKKEVASPPGPARQKKKKSRLQPAGHGPAWHDFFFIWAKKEVVAFFG